MTGNSRFRMILLLFCSSFILVIASPVYLPQFLPGGSGRNIRHLPCVSRRTGETGVCMFAFTCAKAKGTHLGTCIDRFYFGSCCKLDGEADIFPQDNTIDDVPLKAFVTTHGPIESNNIPEYSPKPATTTTRKPIETTVLPANVTKEQATSEKPLKLASTTTTQHVESKPSNFSSSTTTAPTKPTTNKPNITSTTQLSSVSSVTESAVISTVQFVRNNSLATSSTTVSRPTPTITRSTPRPTTLSTTRPPQRPTSPTTTTHTTRPSATSPKPTTPKPVQKPTFQNTTKAHSKPTPRPTTLTSPSSVQLTTVKQPSTTVKPSSTTTRKPSTTTTRKPSTTTTRKPSTTTTRKPSTTTTLKPSTTTTRKPVVVTRFPPRNTTTTTQRPTRRPTTARPPTTTPKTTSSQTQKITTPRPSSTTVQKTKPTLKPTSSSSATSISTGSSKKPATVITESTTPTTLKIPTTLSTIANVSTSSPKPVTVGHRPSISDDEPSSEIPSSVKPITKRPSTTTAKPIVTPSTKPTPAVPNIVSKPGQSTTTTTEPYVVTLGPKPTTVHHTSISSTMEKPFKRPTVITTTTQKPIVPSSNATPSLLVTSPSSTSVFNNEVLPVESPSGLHQGANTNQFESTTHMPGLVTWTSNSDNVFSKFPVIETTTAASEEPTFTEWTPITTPDGWVLIQSPTPDLTTEHITKPTMNSTSTTTQKPSVSKKPPATSSSTTIQPTTKPPLPTADARPSTTEDSISTAALNMSDYKQVCGRRLYPESRIVGGSRSSFGKWPWQISLRQWRTSTYLHKCGAALLNENWAITAAHCVENVPPSDLLLRLGEYDLANEDEPYGFQERRVQIVASHPQFDPRTYEYDLALLRFYEPLLPFQPNTLPICLPDDDATYVGQTAYVTGWGRLYEEGPLPSVLQEVPVPIMNNTVCEAMYRSAGYIEHIPKIFICAGWRKGGFDSCEGDSGGPLVIQRQRDKRWILAGTISWGIGCAEPNQPGVYTRISEFREWINQILQF